MLKVPIAIIHRKYIEKQRNCKDNPKEAFWCISIGFIKIRTTKKKN